MKKQYWARSTGLSLVVAFTISLPRLARADGAATPDLFLHSFLYIWPYCFLAWLMHDWLYRHWKPARSYWGGAAAIVMITAFSFFYDKLYGLLVSEGLTIQPIELMRRGTVISVRSAVVSILVYFLVRYFHLEEEKQQARIEMEQLKQAQLQARLSSLKEQLSPHFLFNTLNTLSSLTREQSVKDYVDQLAQVYRYVLQYKEQDLATLQEELAFIRSYLYILETRLGDAIHVSISIDKKYFQQPIPPLTLQILVENAVKHNITTVRKPLSIAINAVDGWVIVQNKLQPKQSVGLSTGTGLANVLQRYRLLLGKEIRIEQDTDFFTVKLPLSV